MTEQELKSCPFCGSDNISLNEILGKRSDGKMYQQTACMDCGACGPELEAFSQKHEASELWNKRND